MTTIFKNSLRPPAPRVPQDIPTDYRIEVGLNVSVCGRNYQRCLIVGRHPEYKNFLPSLIIPFDENDGEGRVSCLYKTALGFRQEWRLSLGTDRPSFDAMFAYYAPLAIETYKDQSLDRFFR